MEAPFLFDETAISSDPFFYDIYSSLDLSEAPATASSASSSSTTSRPQTGASIYADASSDMASLTSTPSSGGSMQTQGSPKTPAPQSGLIDPFASPLSHQSQREGQSLFAAFQDSFLAAHGAASSSSKTPFSAAQAVPPPLALAPAAPIYSNNPRLKAPTDLRINTNHHHQQHQLPHQTPRSSKVRRSFSAQDTENMQVYSQQPISAPHWQTNFQFSSPSASPSYAPLQPYSSVPQRPSSAMAYQTPPRLYVSTTAEDVANYRVPMSAPAYQTSFDIPPYPMSMTASYSQGSPYGYAPYSAVRASYLAPGAYSNQQYLSPLLEEQGIVLSAPPRPKSAPTGIDNLPPSTPTRPIKKPSAKSRKAAAKSNASASSSSSQFVNFTSADASKLLTGVAPSGSSKRKREEEEEAEAAAAAASTEGASPSKSKKASRSPPAKRPIST